MPYSGWRYDAKQAARHLGHRLVRDAAEVRQDRRAQGRRRRLPGRAELPGRGHRQGRPAPATPRHASGTPCHDRGGHGLPAVHGHAQHRPDAGQGGAEVLRQGPARLAGRRSRAGANGDRLLLLVLRHAGHVPDGRRQLDQVERGPQAHAGQQPVQGPAAAEQRRRATRTAPGTRTAAGSTSTAAGSSPPPSAR